MFGRDRSALCTLVAASVLCASVPASAQAAPCPAARTASAPRMSLEAAPARRGDTLRTIRLCLYPAAATAVGSFHLFIEYDSTLVRAVHFTQGRSGTIVANLTRLGRADVAGADPGGFARGELFAVTFSSRGGATAAARAPGAMVLRLLELNATTGTSIVEHATVTGLGMPAAAAPSTPGRLTPKSAETPHIDSLSPPRAKVTGPGGLVSVTIHGSGFRAEGNVVLFAGTEIAQLTSPDGASLRLVLPSSLPSTSEVPPRMIGAGRYELRVRTSAGTSNPTELTLETPQ